MRKNHLLYLMTSLMILGACSSQPINDDVLPESHVAGHPPASSQPTSTESSSTDTASALDAAYRADQTDELKLLSEKTLIQKPNDVKALAALGVAYYRKGQHGAAAALFSKVNAVTGGNSAAYNNLALLALAKNETSEALQLLRKARELEPDSYPVAANLGAIYASVGDYSKVIYSLENFVKKNQAEPSSLNHYALALVATGQESEAVKIYEKILDSQANHQPTLLNYSVLLIDRQAQYQKGLDLLGRLKFVGVQNDSAALIKDLENKAKAGLK